MTNDIIRVGEVARILNVSRDTVYRWERENPAFPKSTRISKRVSYWRRADILSFLGGE